MQMLVERVWSIRLQKETPRPCGRITRVSSRKFSWNRSVSVGTGSGCAAMMARSTAALYAGLPLDFLSVALNTSPPAAARRRSGPRDCLPCSAAPRPGS
jgi:hypothetical protein